MSDGPSQQTGRGARVIVVMGVTASGKSTVGRLLARRLGVPFVDADEFHPTHNIAKMAAGEALDDDDRQPWLRAVAEWIAEQTAAGGGVVACSALKRRYRDVLRASGHAWFIHLTVPRAVLAARLEQRAKHFMPPSLLDSQLSDLEPLDPDEHGTTLEQAGRPPAELADLAAAQLNRLR